MNNITKFALVAIGGAAFITVIQVLTRTDREPGWGKTARNRIMIKRGDEVLNWKYVGSGIQADNPNYNKSANYVCFRENGNRDMDASVEIWLNDQGEIYTIEIHGIGLTCTYLDQVIPQEQWGYWQLHF